MKNKLVSYAAVFVFLAVSLMYSPDARAVIGQKYFGDGATPSAGGWTYVGATDSSCMVCHVPGGPFGAPDKTSYLMTGHRNALRKATVFSFWSGPDGLPYDTDSSGRVIFWNTPGPISLGTSTTYPPLLDGSCSLSGYLNQSACQSAGGTWTSAGVGNSLFYIYDGWMNAIAGAGAINDPSTSIAAPGAVIDGGTYSCARCHTTGMTLDSAVTTTRPPAKTYPNINTYVNFDPDGNGPATTASWAFGSTSGQTMEGVQCERCHDATRHFTTGPTVQRGVAATALCLQCHRQEHTASYTGGGLGANIHPTPFSDNGALPVSEPTYSIPAIEVGRSDGNYGRVFFGYSTGMEFLNGTHGKYTGSFQQVNNPANYSSGFMVGYCSLNGFATYSDQPSCESVGGAWTDARGCIFNQTNCVANAGTWTVMQGGCTTCHDVHNSLAVASQKAAAVKTTCEDCHVNNATTQANIGSVPTVTPAIINHPTVGGTPFDTTRYDNACVVCHMASQAAANGDQITLPAHVWRISTDASYNTFPTMAQFYGGSCSLHTGAVQNAPSKPVVYLSDTSSANCTAALGTWTPATQARTGQTAPDGSYTPAVWVDLDLACGQCHGGSLGSGATHNGAPYFDKPTLAGFAPLMHPAKALVSSGTATPVVSYTALTVTGWTVSFTDTSTCADGAPNIIVNWGDGSPSASGAAGSMFSHTYGTTRARSYTISQVAQNPANSRLSAVTRFAVNVPQRYTISGLVTTSTGTPIPGAYLYLKDAVTNRSAKFTRSLSNGTFTFTGVLPNTNGYKIHVYKYRTTVADVMISNAQLATNPTVTITATNP